MDSKCTIGIDLGTTYCSVAVFQNGIVKVLEDELGNRRIPSYVAFTDDECLVGFTAKSQASSNPGNTVYGVKRLLGCKFDDKVVASNRKYWPFCVIDENGTPKIEVQYKKATTSFSPEEITAMLLTKMKELAEEHFSTSVSNAVISVPANFNYLQRMATVNAASIAGLNVLQLINEPTAAALVYCTEKKITGTRNLLVFALGGGSFDVSLVSIQDGKLEVKAVSGETHLGGEDFDNNLLSHMPKNFQQNDTTDITKKRLFTRLKNTCEGAKKDLSKLHETSIQVEGCDYSYDSCAVNREMFTKYNDELYSKIIFHVDKVLKHARSCKFLEDDEIVEILLVGGSTRMPYVEELLKSSFSGVRISKSINRDEAVTCGAAVQAALLNGDKFDSTIHLVEDITPRSLCINLKDNILGICIPAHSKIPSQGTILTFQSIPQMSQVPICSIREMSQNTQKDVLESFHVTINDSNPSSQCDVHVGVRVYINDNGILVLEGLNAEIIREQNFISTEDIKTMKRTAKKIKNDYKLHQEVMQCRDNLEGYIIKVQAEFQSMSDIYSERNTVLNVSNDILNWMSYNEGAAKEDYNVRQEYLQSLREQKLTALHSIASKRIQISKPENQSTLNSVSTCTDTEVLHTSEFSEQLNTNAESPNPAQHVAFEIVSDQLCDTSNPHFSISSNQDGTQNGQTSLVETNPVSCQNTYIEAVAKEDYTGNENDLPSINENMLTSHSTTDNQSIANCVSTSNHTEVQPTSELNHDLIDLNTELTNHPQHTQASPSDPSCNLSNPDISVISVKYGTQSDPPYLAECIQMSIDEQQKPRIGETTEGNYDLKL